MAEKPHKQEAAHEKGMTFLLEAQLTRYQKLDETTPRDVRLAALGALGLAEGLAIIGFNTKLLQKIAKIRSKLITSLRSDLEAAAPRSKGQRQQFRIFYAKRLPELPFITPDFFLEAHYHDLGEVAAQNLAALYPLLNDPDDKVFVAKCEALSTHTSLSVGDVVKDPSSRYWLCQNLGWKELLSL